jgi:hypothetical protein
VNTVTPTMIEMERFLHQWVTTGLPTSPEPPPVLYHYTDASALNAILHSRVLRATNAILLNDENEIKYSLKLLKACIDDRSGAADLGAPNTTSDRAMWATVQELLRFTEVYVSCFCESGDLLSQWRGYGERGRYALGYSSESLSRITKGRLALVKVNYSQRDHEQHIRDLVSRWRTQLENAPLQDEDDRSRWIGELIFAEAFTALAVGFKDPAFAEEREWRLVYRYSSRSTSEGAQLDDGLGLQFDVVVRGNLLVPYVTLGAPDGEAGRLPPSRIVVGPTRDPVLAGYAVERSLKLLGYPSNSVRVDHSAVPLRIP